ncbi:MAG: alanine--glyoxylate aminotransferase family protein [Sulfuricurvum sp.]
MLLFTPGPTPVPQNVRDAMSSETIHHRTPEFEEIFAKTRGYLFELFGMEEVLLLASSGTGAMEAAVTNLCHDTLLNINSGKFGQRFGRIALASGLKNVEITNEWDTPASVDEVLEALESNPSIDAIALQVSESAGGLRHSVEEIAKAVKEHNPNIMVIADGITAVGVEKIDVTNIDALVAGSQKAFMLPPGLAMVALSKKAIEKIGSGRGYYFNLASEIKNQRKNTTAYTAATTLIIGLLEFFKSVDRMGGFDALYNETKKRSEAFSSAMQALGLRIYPKRAAICMTTIASDEANEIRKVLKNSFSVNVAGGQDHLNGKIFRVNQMGLIKEYEMVWVANAIELALEKMGKRAFDGTANRIFLQEYMK